MPPKRGKKAAAAAAPPAPPLRGCNIAFSGTFKGLTHGALKIKAEALGAAVSAAIVASATTHLIASEADFKKRTAKVASADDNKLPIVTVDWLLQSEKDNTRAPEADFALNSTTTLPVRRNGSAQVSGSKRPLSPAPNASDDDEAPKPKTRATKASKAKKAAEPEVKARIEADDKAEVDDAKPAKPIPAVGEGQVLKKKDARIPLDEGCPLTTSVVYIDPDGVIYDASLNQTHASRNNNKFYRIQVRHLLLITLILADEGVVGCGPQRQVSRLDPMGPCWRAWPECNPRWRFPTGSLEPVREEVQGQVWPLLERTRWATEVLKVCFRRTQLQRGFRR